MKSELLDFTETNLTAAQRRIVQAFLQRHHHVIGRDDTDLGVAYTVTHSIDTQGAMPVKQRYLALLHRRS